MHPAYRTSADQWQEQQPRVIALDSTDPRSAPSYSQNPNAYPSAVRRRYDALPSSRRSSVFNLRPRSNTTNSTESSHKSRTMTMTSSERFSSWSPPDDGPRWGQQVEVPDRQSSRARSFWSRSGRKPRRQGSKLSVSSISPTTEDERSDLKLRLRTSRPKTEQSHDEGARHRLKESISSPFNFQHLTHTQKQQLPSLQGASQNELVAEFSAARASQVPRKELHGIKADDLRFQGFSSMSPMPPVMPPLDRTASDGAASEVTPFPTLRAQRSGDQIQIHHAQSSAGRPSLRHTRSTESFSQPMVKRYPVTPITPPPRLSSLAAGTHTGEGSIKLQHSPPPEDQTTPPQPCRPSDPEDEHNTAGPSLGRVDAVDTLEPVLAIHAVTTPDLSARPAVSPVFQSSLDHVPEDQETYFQDREVSASEESPICRGAFLRPQTGSGLSKKRNPQLSLNLPRSTGARSFSRASDILGSPFSPGTSCASCGPSPYGIPASPRGLFNSWEDDIDWCYEHEAEADCDFQWGVKSPHSHGFNREKSFSEMDDGALSPCPPTEEEEAPRPSTSLDTRAEDDYLQTRFFPGAFRPSLLVSTPQDVPELALHTGISASTAPTSAGAITPRESFPPMPPTSTPVSSEPEFPLRPSFLVPQDSKIQVLKETMFEQMLDDEASDRHYPLLDGDYSSHSSTRSSHAHLSKCSSYTHLSKISSYDYSNEVSAKPSFSSLIRRSDSSASSLPELVHSVEWQPRKLSDVPSEPQPTPFTHVQEEFEHDPELQAFSSYYCDHTQDDSDTERASSANTARTFFQSHSELDVARMETPPPSPSALYHERAASDGAAKLLSMASNGPKSPQVPQRSRAASAGASRSASRIGYSLSLFPPPPKSRKRNL